MLADADRLCGCNDVLRGQLVRGILCTETVETDMPVVLSEYVRWEAVEGTALQSVAKALLKLVGRWELYGACCRGRPQGQASCL